MGQVFAAGCAGAVLLAAAVIAAPADGNAEEAAPDSPAAPFDPIQVPSGARPLAIAHVADIPRQLDAAIGRAQCRVEESQLKDRPVLIFRPADGYRVMALVPCQAIVSYSRAFLFDRTLQSEPSPMMFPVVAASGGFSASNTPGLMFWDPAGKTLTAWKGNDYCPARESRHTYRQAAGELNGFALVKVEYRDLRCTVPEVDWKIVWQATPWNLQP
jgi:hypothetical protein